MVNIGGGGGALVVKLICVCYFKVQLQECHIYYHFLPVSLNSDTVPVSKVICELQNVLHVCFSPCIQLVRLLHTHNSLALATAAKPGTVLPYNYKLAAAVSQYCLP